MTRIVFNIYKWLKTIIIHLWLSVSSIGFYQRILLFYEGYGLKYILTLSFIASLFCSIYILNFVDNVKNYLAYGTISTDVANLDHVISQFPEINYDGSKISLSDKEPIYINNTDNVPVVAIDPENKIPGSIRSKISILFASKNLIISFFNAQNSNVSTFPIEYSQIFGAEPKLLTQEDQKTYLENLFNKAPTALTYLIFPMLGVLIFINIFLEKAFLIIAIYLLSNVMSKALTIKICSRLVMFSSGIFTIMQPIALFTKSEYHSILWLIQLWSNFLMIVAILKTSKIVVKKTK